MNILSAPCSQTEDLCSSCCSVECH